MNSDILLWAELRGNKHKVMPILRQRVPNAVINIQASPKSSFALLLPTQHSHIMNGMISVMTSNDILCVILVSQFLVILLPFLWSIIRMVDYLTDPPLVLLQLCFGRG